MEERDRRLDRRVDEIFRLVKQNNAMLKREKASRMFKTSVVVILFTGILGYGYYIFAEYRGRIIEFQEKVNQLHNQTEKILDLGSQVKDTAQSFSEVFESRDE